MSQIVFLAVATIFWKCSIFDYLNYNIGFVGFFFYYYLFSKYTFYLKQAWLIWRMKTQNRARQNKDQNAKVSLVCAECVHVVKWCTMEVYRAREKRVARGEAKSSFSLSRFLFFLSKYYLAYLLFILNFKRCISTGMEQKKQEFLNHSDRVDGNLPAKISCKPWVNYA